MTYATNSIRTVEYEGDYIAEINVDIPLRNPDGLARCNVFRPKETEADARLPVLMTMGPYGKDIHYKDFHPKSWADVPEEQRSKYSAWETPDPAYWTSHGYVVVRVDERGLGQSPGFMDTMSATTASDFAQCIEWAAEQPWCDGKVGLLGISYYAGSQWRVAARKPKGLTCIIPWEGMTDYMRDRCRQGGIYSNGFIKFWWDRQVVSNQYGLGGRAARNWGPDPIEGVIPDEQLVKNRRDQVLDNTKHFYSDDPYYASREYDLGDIDVPLLSVANLGGITLHLRGNVVGYIEAGSKNKWLHFISGRHDIPFYLPEYVGLQKSFLDAWLKGKDDRGWLEGPNAKVPAVQLLIRKGNPGFNKTEAERTFTTRSESEWPLARTQYQKWFLTPDLKLARDAPSAEAVLETQGLTGDKFQFSTPPFEQDTEITGHFLANLSMGVEGIDGEPAPKDLDVFVTLRHIDADGKEVFYTGTAGDPVPVVKGWLRASMRKITPENKRHREYQPYRAFASTDRAYLEPNTPHDLLVELWPSNVVVSKGGHLVLEVSPKDEQGCGIFTHDHPEDRSEESHGGKNLIYFGSGHDNWLQLPVIPATAATDEGIQNGAALAASVTAEESPLKVVIVGAGIGGLTAALALRKDGHEITILEQSRMKSEIGAAIHVAPNASRILASLGVDMAEHGASFCRGAWEYGKEGTVHFKLDVDPIKMVGHPWTLNHRVDLHTAIKTKVLDPSIPGPVPTLRGESKVTAVDAEAGIVTLASGEQVRGDLIIGADGIHSVIRDSIVGEEKIAKPSGLSAYRCLIHKDKLMDIPEAVELLSSRDAHLSIVTSPKDERVVMYPCRESTVLNIVAMCPDEFLNEQSSEGWARPGKVEDMLETFKEFPPWVVQIFSRAENPGLWQLRDQDPFPHWVKRRVIVIGDAAHAMLPHQGQGGGQAIEDAEALGAFFEDLTRSASLEEVNSRLNEVFDVRYDRASVVQRFTREQALPAEGGQTLLNARAFMPWMWGYLGAKDWKLRQQDGRDAVPVV